MKEYEVTMEVELIEIHVVIIEAESEEEAKIKVLDGDYDGNPRIIEGDIIDNKVIKIEKL